jgi:hypothetical protein
MPREGLRVNPDHALTCLRLGEVGRGSTAYRAPRRGGDDATQGDGEDAGGTGGV